jgi:hypothetical protein
MLQARGCKLSRDMHTADLLDDVVFQCLRSCKGKESFRLDELAAAKKGATNASGLHEDPLT